MPDHFKGLLITFAGVIVLSPDTLLIRLAALDQWSLLFYRGLLMAAGITLLCRVFDKTPLVDQFSRTGRSGLVMAGLFTISTVSFVSATMITTIAHTLIIVATSPLFAALLSWLLLKERLQLHTLFAIIMVLGGMVVVMGSNQPGSHWLGNLCALSSAICIAATFVLNRKSKHISMVPAMSLSGLLTAVIALPFISFRTMSHQSMLALALMGLVITVAFALITLGPRYIRAAEVSLILPLETVGGVALAWVFLAEVPSNQTLIGATIILVALTMHAYFSLRKSRNIPLSRSGLCT